MARILVGASAIALLLIAGAMVLFWRGAEAEAAIEKSWQMREQASRLADELRQSSDDLTRMARTYAATGDERYRRYFEEILAIRNGAAPRPDDYHLVYWDLVTADGERPRAAGDAVALHDLMEEAGVTAAELALLTGAEDESNRLTGLENRAFEAVRTGDRATAQQLLHSAEYHQAKAQIMLPLLRFFEALDVRTAAEVAALLARKEDLNRYMLAVVVLLLALTAVSLVLALVAHRSRSASETSAS